MGFNKIYGMVVMMVVVVLSASNFAKAQNDCAQKLIPCADYMNSTNPPATCCNPIKEAVNTQKECLCNVLNTPGLLASFNITLPQALNLTQACGVKADTTMCNAHSPSSSMSPPPPGVPGNDGGRIAWSGVSTLLLIWASMMLY